MIYLLLFTFSINMIGNISSYESNIELIIQKISYLVSSFDNQPSLEIEYLGRGHGTLEISVKENNKIIDYKNYEVLIKNNVEEITYDFLKFNKNNQIYEIIIKLTNNESLESKTYNIKVTSANKKTFIINKTTNNKIISNLYKIEVDKNNISKNIYQILDFTNFFVEKQNRIIESKKYIFTSNIDENLIYEKATIELLHGMEDTDFKKIGGKYMFDSKIVTNSNKYYLLIDGYYYDYLLDKMVIIPSVSSYQTQNIILKRDYNQTNNTIIFKL